MAPIEKQPPKEEIPEKQPPKEKEIPCPRCGSATEPSDHKPSVEGRQSRHCKQCDWHFELQYQ
jgi:transposase-like protein